MNKRMKLNCIKIIVAVAALTISLSSFSQDLVARQAPIDKKFKSVDSLALHKQIQDEQAEMPAFDLYPNWSNVNAHNYATAIVPESYTIDLTGFCMPTTQRDSENDAVMKLMKFLPHECVLGDTKVPILLSESHVHVYTLEKMTPRKYVH